MAKDLPPLGKLSAVSFIDYVRLRDLLKQEGRLPTEVLNQHNQDTVTYQDAYNYVSKAIEQANHYTDYTSDLVSALIALLVEKGIVSQKEVRELARSAGMKLQQQQ